MMSFLLNPGKRRKARRVKGRARRHGRKHHARRSHRKHHRKHRTHARRHHRKARHHRRATARRHRRRSKKASLSIRLSNPGRKHRRHRRKHSRAANPHRRFHRKHHRKSHRRHRNPGMGGALSLNSAAWTLVPALKFPIPGPAIVGKLVHGTVQGLIYGSVGFGGYWASGFVVDQAVKILPASIALSRWTRPVIFAAVGASLAGVVVKFLPVKNKAAWTLAIAGGAFLRAACGLLANLIPATQNTALNSIRESAAQMADYIQTDGMYEAGLGSGSDVDIVPIPDGGTSDYIQTDGLYEAGMGDTDDYIQTDGEMEEAELAGI